MPLTESAGLEKVAGQAAEIDGDPTRFVDRYIQVGTIKARYWAAGEGGAPIVLLHGFGASVELWRFTLPALAKHHRVLAVDLPGFGRSDKPEAPYTLSYLAAFVRDFLDAMGMPRATLVGNSLGGGVALRFALDFPARLERLGLVAPAALGRGGSPLLRLMSLPGVGELLSRPSRAGTARLFRLATHNPAVVTDTIVDEAYQLARLPGTQRGFLGALRALVNPLGQRREIFGPILDGLPLIAAPTLVLWGRQDRFVPVAHAGAARAISGVRVEVWDPCGHLPMIERPGKFSALLLDFLSQK
ncbi:MAG: alpha/beta fold hydrolase [Burkholderiales bacterium]